MIKETSELVANKYWYNTSNIKLTYSASEEEYKGNYAVVNEKISKVKKVTQNELSKTGNTKPLIMNETKHEKY